MFSLVHALPSPNLRRVRVLVVRLDHQYYGAVRLLPGVHARRAVVTFTDRSGSFDPDTQEISRFSCMLFLSVRGIFDYAGPTSRSRFNATRRVAFHLHQSVGILKQRLFEAQ